MSGLTGMPERMDAQAELTTLRWVAIHLVESHDRHQAQLAAAYPTLALPTACGCPLCRQARPWVERRNPQQPGKEEHDVAIQSPA